MYIYNTDLLSKGMRRDWIPSHWGPQKSLETFLNFSETFMGKLSKKIFNFQLVTKKFLFHRSSARKSSFVILSLCVLLMWWCKDLVFFRVFVNLGAPSDSTRYNNEDGGDWQLCFTFVRWNSVSIGFTRKKNISKIENFNKKISLKSIKLCKFNKLIDYLE